MVAGFYIDNDGRFRQYGVSKAVPETGGDYLAYGETRMQEYTIDLTTLIATPLIQSYTTLFPGNNTQLFVEKVVIDVEVGATGGTSLSVGTGFMSGATTTNNLGVSVPAVTPISNTAFVSALVTASIATAGQQITMTTGSTSAGGYIGTTSADQVHKNYVSALAVGTFATGRVKVRIFYRGLGTITQ